VNRQVGGPVPAVGAAQGKLMLDKHAALVCGATGHIGSAVARVLAEAGASVGVHYLHKRARALELAGQLPGEQAHTAVMGDLSDPASAQQVFAQAAEKLGAAPTVVIDAAYPSQPPRYVRDLTDDYLEWHLNGLRTPVNVCRAALPGMREAGWGRIVLISGALAWRPFPGFSMYAAAKAGAAAFARTLALEEGRDGITVNILALGRIEHRTGERAFSPDPAYEALDEITHRRVALSRMASPEDIAATVRYLVSPEAEAVTGQVLFLAGGEPM
jgi:NAD(P)-dependent dehydrogenase (short-subunit alcohol dehydrogenase family)